MSNFGNINNTTFGFGQSQDDGQTPGGCKCLLWSNWTASFRAMGDKGIVLWSWKHYKYAQCTAKVTSNGSFSAVFNKKNKTLKIEWIRKKDCKNCMTVFDPKEGPCERWTQICWSSQANDSKWQRHRVRVGGGTADSPMWEIWKMRNDLANSTHKIKAWAHAAMDETSGTMGDNLEACRSQMKCKDTEDLCIHGRQTPRTPK